MAHQLKIGVEDILQDPNYIRVIDWSEYDNRMSVTNRVLKIDIPLYNVYKLVNLPQSGSITYSSKSLKLSKVVEQLPDGIWRFTYSICPNERKFVVYTHFRTVQLENRIMQLVAKGLVNETIKKEFQPMLTECLLNLKALKSNSIDDYNSHKAYELYQETERIYNILKQNY